MFRLTLYGKYKKNRIVQNVSVVTSYFFREVPS